MNDDYYGIPEKNLIEKDFYGNSFIQSKRYGVCKIDYEKHIAIPLDLDLKRPRSIIFL